MRPQNTTKPARRRRRVARSKAKYVPVIRRGFYGQSHIHQFKRKLQKTTIVSNANGAFQFQLNDMPNYTEFSTLFDCYKIVGIKLHFLPYIQENIDLTKVFGQVATCIDYTDASTPATFNEVLEYQNAKLHIPTNRGFTLYFRPRAAVAIYDGLTTAYAQSDPKTWINTSNPDVPYYGVKYAWNGVTTNMSIAVYATYYVKFKQVK